MNILFRLIKSTIYYIFNFTPIGVINSKLSQLVVKT